MLVTTTLYNREILNYPQNRDQGGRGGTAGTHVTTSEVPTLNHEFGNDPVEGRSLIAKALLASAKGAEVLGRLRDILIEEVEDNSFRFS